MSTRDVIVVEDSFTGYSPNSFNISPFYKECLDHVLIPYGLINDRTAKIAKDILDGFKGEPFVAICVLKGAFKFFSLLLDQMKLSQQQPISLEFTRLRSYTGTESSGAVQFLIPLNMDSLSGRNVLIVEDIIDTGTTMKSLIELINSSEKRPKRVKVATLLEKRLPEGSKFQADFVGFSIPNRFVVGCGTDYNEVFRDLDHLCVLNHTGIAKFA